MEQKLTKEEREDMERRKYTTEEEKDSLIPNLRHASAALCPPILQMASSDLKRAGTAGVRAKTFEASANSLLQILKMILRSRETETRIYRWKLVHARISRLAGPVSIF